jgi:hypothetical protein
MCGSGEKETELSLGQGLSMPASLGKFKQSGESVVHQFESCRRRSRVEGGAGLRARIRRRRLVAFRP